MCNHSKKTIKKIDRMLRSRCKKYTKFYTGVKLYNFRKGTEAGYFIGTTLDESGHYKFFGIISPEQVWEVA